MSCWYFVTIIFFLNLISGHENDLLHFSRNIAVLSECIEYRLPANFKGQFDPTIIKLHIARAAEKLSGKTIRRKDVFSEIVENKTNSSRLELKKEIEKAIKECSIIEGYKNDNETNSSYISVPKFDNEPAGFARILNYVLVNWTDPLDQMIRTQNGRALLRRYVNNIQSELQCGLASFNRPEFFRTALRILWLHRAQMIFDGRSVSLPYITHRFAIDSDEPYLNQSYLHLFHNRNPQNFAKRNPLVPQLFLDRFLNIHVRDNYSSYDGEYDVYSRYNRGISSAEYYFERHMDQFYRILFYIHELSSRNVTSDEEDIYDGPIPDAVMSNRLQCIIYDDNQYRDYLLRRRNLEVTLGDIQNPIIKNLARNSRVHEEFLVMLWEDSSVASRIHSSTTPFTTTSETTTTSTTRTISTTPNYHLSKKEKNSSNKYGTQSRTRDFADYFGYAIKKPDSGLGKNRKKCKDSCFRERYNHHFIDLPKEVLNTSRAIPAPQKLQEITAINSCITLNNKRNQLKNSMEEVRYIGKILQLIFDELELAASF